MHNFNHIFQNFSGNMPLDPKKHAKESNLSQESLNRVHFVNTNFSKKSTSSLKRARKGSLSP